MKKFKAVNLIYSICLTMLISYIPFTQESEVGNLRLGFPYKFYTIHTNSFDKFSIHFSIGVFALDVLIFYIIFMLILALIKKIRTNF